MKSYFPPLPRFAGQVLRRLDMPKVNEIDSNAFLERIRVEQLTRTEARKTAQIERARKEKKSKKKVKKEASINQEGGES